ncbi:MAG: hypothetical protein M3O30_12465 [Planctomycetota bacterium]|nr:hypothetical protein [Planctomycetota bacterium]
MRVVHIVLGVWLLAAAVLKVQADSHSPGGDHSNWLTSRFALLAEAGLEAVLGAWLIAGAWRAVVRWVGVAFFIGVGCVAVAEALGHQASCGCFGSVAIPPWLTATLDVAAVILLWLCPPEIGRTFSWRRIIVGVGILVCVAAVALRMEMSVVVVGNLVSDSGQMDFGVAGSTVVLETTQWIGKRLPIAQHIDVWPQISHGRWVVLLVHYDCRHCMAAVDNFEAEAANSASNSRAPRLAVIELPPYAPATEPVSHAPTLGGSLDNQRDWFASTPVALLLEDGTVRASIEANEAQEPRSEWWAGK